MQQDFSKQLIKGKIAEVIFEQMFRESGNYTVIPFGYETVIPELIQLTRSSENRDLLDNIRNAPDFALVSHVPKEVLLVEVKYRSRLALENLATTAKQTSDRWKLAWVFFATPEGFYFDKCLDLEKPGAQPTPLAHDLISQPIQDKYIKLLKEFML